MLMIALVLVALLALAAVCAVRLMRPKAARVRLLTSDVSPMRAALERRMREGDLPL